MERSDLTDAGGLRTRRRAVGGKQSFNKAKLIPVAAEAYALPFSCLFSRLWAISSINSCVSAVSLPKTANSSFS